MSDTALASEWLPLAPAQLDFWEEYTLHPGQTLSTVAHCTELCGAIEEAALCRAIAATLAETQAFALRFGERRGDHPPPLRHEPQRIPSLQRIDLQTHRDPWQAAQSLMHEDIAQHRALHREPLAAAWLLKLGPERYLWYVRAHHILVDGFGMALIEHRCAALYAHYLGQGSAGIPLGAFAPFQQAELAYVDSERCERDRRFWQAYLPPSQALPTVRKGGGEYGVRRLSVNRRLPTEVAQRLAQQSERSGINWPDLLVALSAVWLFQVMPRHARQGDALPMWMPAMNRRGQAATNVPSLAVNTLPLLVSPSPMETLGSFLTTLTQQLRELRSHAGYRLRQLAADRGVDPNSRFFISPFINVQPFDAPRFVGCRGARRVLAGGSGDGFNLTYRGRTDARDLQVDIDIYLEQFPTEDALDYGEVLQEFLLRALQREAWEQPLAALTALPA
ncbi:condensation domain-containing protein [Serratia sp. TSA_130.2]|uniref:condensation domain-containing protein n=1 Tax=Serratia TaxID=613 RepID=UPI0005382ED1|nr:MULTISPECIES: condensation domain-containing protein [Serratia]KAB5496915.1 condensation protein [Enterobacter sp. RJAL6]AYU93005.1 condensation protein [Serratia sp. LS-1]KKO56606.1 condensation domain protein [Serratia ureilytica]MBH2561537.1 condensation protein [Serratia ureilytica]MBH2640381.1 condensation protein [Serratia ureilytica]